MALSHDEINALFAEVREEWNQAEEIVKAAEQICAEAVFPSIKEFRYAGRRLVDTFNELANGADMPTINGFIKDAVFNCHCARHDAIDVATATIATNLDLVGTKIGYEVALKAFPQFSELRHRLIVVRGKIRASRADRTNRNAIYTSIHDADLPGLASMYDQFQAAEPIMKSLARKQRSEQLFLRVTTVVAILIAAASFFYGVMKKPDAAVLTLPAGAVVTVPALKAATPYTPPPAAPLAPTPAP